MFDFTTAPEATGRELDSLRNLLAGLDEPAWSRPVRCAGWTVTDLVAHIVGAARGQADGLAATALGREQLAVLDPPKSRDPLNLRDLLDRAAKTLLDALSALTPDLAEATVPLPFGPVPVVLALQIVPLEYGFHRNDLLDALGTPQPLPADIAASLIDILPGLLPVLAAGSAVGRPGDKPERPIAFELSCPCGQVTMAYDGTQWTPSDQLGSDCRIDGSDSDLALFAMGRIPVTSNDLNISNPSLAVNFKNFFPGP